MDKPNRINSMPNQNLTPPALVHQYRGFPAYLPNEFTLQPDQELIVIVDCTAYDPRLGVSKATVDFVNNETTGTDPNDNDPFESKGYTRNYRVEGTASSNTGIVAGRIDNKHAIWQFPTNDASGKYQNLNGTILTWKIKNISGKTLFNAFNVYANIGTPGM